MGKLEQTYAQSLFELAKEKGIAERVYKEYDQFRNFLMGQDDIFSILKNPQISKEEKKEILSTLLSDSSQFFRNYAQVLVDKKREKLLISAFKDFRALYFEDSGFKEVIVETAQPLTLDQKTNLENLLNNKYERKIIITEIVDSSLMMGFRILVDGKEIDCTLDGAFYRLKGKLKQMNGVTK